MNENSLHDEIILLLNKESSSYAFPVNSEYIGKKLQISPSYVRTQMCKLIKAKQVAVRRGNGGGYYCIGGKNMEMSHSTLVDKNEVLIDSIEYMIQYSRRLTAGLRDVAIQLQTGLTNKAFEKLPDAIDGMSLMLQLIQSCIVVMELEPQKVEQCMKMTHLFGEQIGQMNLSIGYKDYGKLADQCEYELVELIEEQVSPILDFFYELAQNKHTA